MKRSLVLAAAAAATLFTATAANAGGVHWSVGINLPPVATVVSSGPAYYPCTTSTPMTAAPTGGAEAKGSRGRPTGAVGSVPPRP